MGRASRTDRGGGTEPVSCLPRRVSPARRGTFTVRPEALAETFLQDCDPEIRRQAMDKTAQQSLAVLEQPVQSAAWQHVPSTYLVCVQDLGTPPTCSASSPGEQPASWNS